MKGAAREWRADAIAGLSVAGLMLPEAVAYAGIAGLPAGRAISAAIGGGLVYAVMGRSRFAIVAPTSSSAAILAAALATLSASAADKGLLATAIIVVVGVTFLIMSALRLGGIAAFISRPVLHGFGFGLAVTIVVKQLPTLSGLHIRTARFVDLIGQIVSHLGAINPASLAIGLGALCSLLLFRRYTRLPGALIVLLAGTSLSLMVDLPSLGVALVGPVSIAFEFPNLPDFAFEQWAKIVQLALPLTLILFAESWGTMRALALRHGDMLSANRELAALGGANMAAALAHGMPVGAGFSAGSASEAAGATTRATAFVAVLALTVLVLLEGPAIARIPEPVLAAIVIAALTHALAPAPIMRLFRIDRDQWIAVVAALGVILLGVLNGMLFAVVLSLAALLRRLAAPVVSELGQLRAGHDFVDLARHADASRITGLAIFRPNAPLFFGNADAALGQISARSAACGAGAAIILSLEESDDLDSTAVEAIGEFAKTLAARNQTLRLARLHDQARAVLNAASMTTLTEMAGYSVADAVVAATQRLEPAHA